jgi:hypothetical protein
MICCASRAIGRLSSNVGAVIVRAVHAAREAVKARSNATRATSEGDFRHAACRRSSRARSRVSVPCNGSFGVPELVFIGTALIHQSVCDSCRTWRLPANCSGASSAIPQSTAQSERSQIIRVQATMRLPSLQNPERSRERAAFPCSPPLFSRCIGDTEFASSIRQPHAEPFPRFRSFGTNDRRPFAARDDACTGGRRVT